MRAWATLFALVLATSAHAATTSSVSVCTEVETCNTEGRCEHIGFKLALNEVMLRNTQTGALQQHILAMGPMMPQAGGGLFFDTDWTMENSPPSLRAAQERQNVLVAVDATTRAFVVRPGREVREFQRDDWVMTEFTCEQVVF